VQESCTDAFTTQVTDPALFGGGVDLIDQEFTLITQLQPINLQDTACRIKLADLGLKFSSRKVHLLTGVMHNIEVGNS